MKKIFVHCYLSKKQKKFLQKNFKIKIHNSNNKILSDKELIKFASGYDGIICQGNTVCKEYIEKNKNKLRAISNVSVGFDNVDIKVATEKKIAVFNTPNILNNTVADLAIGLIIAVSRKICEANNYVKKGAWKKNSWPLFLGDDLNDELLGIIGMGNIGKKVAIRAKSFGLKIKYNNRNRISKEEETKYSAEYYSLKKLLKLCKYVLLLLPLNKQTKHLINKNTFSVMRKDAYIINVARGKIIKEEDLVEALEKKKIAGAALDVFEFEPKVHRKLKYMKNTVLMPHAGSASLSTRESMVDLACKNISDFLLFNKIKNIVNKDLI